MLSTDPAHFLSCQSFRRGTVTHRHNNLTQCLARLVRRAGGAAYVEPSWLDIKRPDIHVAFPDSHFLVDGSITSHCHVAAFTRLHATLARESRKSKKYDSLAQKEDCKFVAFVMESFGGFGVHAKHFLDELIRQSRDHSQPSVIRFRDYAIRSLSICLLNGNCFVLHNGCLRISEWDGRYRRDRHREASRRTATYVYRPVSVNLPPPLAPQPEAPIDLTNSDEPPAPAPSIRVNLIIPPAPDDGLPQDP